MKTSAGAAVLAVLGLVLAECWPRAAHAAPSVEVSLVPPWHPGGTPRLARIDGRVIGAQPGQRIVLYARSGAWYVQPWADRPFTTIRPDGTWTSTTHLGTEYAVLLVDPAYQPDAMRDALPAPGGAVFAVAVVEGEPVFWRTWWFRWSCVLAGVLAVWGLHRFRLRQLAAQLNLRFEERLSERTRIAQHLYDTLLQGLLGSSMQLRLAVDQVPEDSQQKAHLDRVVRMMAQATEEGRRVLQGLRSSEGEADRLEDSLSRIRHELCVPDATLFRVRAFGTVRRLHPIIRDEAYRVGREALVNALRHSNAREVEVEVHYSAKALRVLVRDDGCGIDGHVVDVAPECDRGLSSMRQRAERLGGRLRVKSKSGAGTEVELSVPGGIAFRTSPPVQSKESIP